MDGRLIVFMQPTTCGVVAIGNRRIGEFSADDESLAGEYSQISTRDGVHVICPWGEKTVVRLNEGRLRGRTLEVLRNGDSIRVGQMRLVYHDWKPTSARQGSSALKPGQRLPSFQYASRPVHRPALKLKAYADWLGDLPLPTDKQQESFVQYVARAHDWYKDLPMLLPGTTFFFYLNPLAGYQETFTSHHGSVFEPRYLKESERNRIATWDCRERFGYLDYADGHRSIAFDRFCDLPAAVLLAGAVDLTAVVHPATSISTKWGRVLKKPKQDLVWPEESGGLAILEQVLACCKMTHQGIIDVQLSADLLHKLLAPERARQYQGMIKAIQRVCALTSDLTKTS